VLFKLEGRFGEGNVQEENLPTENGTGWLCQAGAKCQRFFSLKFYINQTAIDRWTATCFTGHVSGGLGQEEPHLPFIPSHYSMACRGMVTDHYLAPSPKYACLYGPRIKSEAEALPLVSRRLDSKLVHGKPD